MADLPTEQEIVNDTGNPLPVSGTVTANAGTNLNTSALALETTQSAGNTLTGAVTETAPGTDTASSGLNGRLQRIAQRLTSLIALLPVSLGQKTMANSFAVVIANDQTVIPVKPGGSPATYAASITGLAPALLATDIFTITGSATKIIRITKINISGVQTSAGAVNILQLKRSTANTGGTSTTPTIVPYDSTDAAGTAVIRAYTANPTLGTLVGTIEVDRVFLSTGAGSSGNSADDIYFYGSPRFAKEVILNSTSEVFAINLNSTTLAGALFDITIEWTES